MHLQLTLTIVGLNNCSFANVYLDIGIYVFQPVLNCSSSLTPVTFYELIFHSYPKNDTLPHDAVFKRPARYCNRVNIKASGLLRQSVG
jgi:hypothetical protein